MENYQPLISEGARNKPTSRKVLYGAGLGMIGIICVCGILSVSSTPSNFISMHAEPIEFDAWKLIEGTMKQVSVGAFRHVYAVDTSDKVYARIGGTWYLISGSLKQISVGEDGTVCGVNSKNEVYRLDSEGWYMFPGVSLTQVDVGNKDNIWGVDANSKVWKYNGTTFTQIDGTLVQISVAADGTVIGVSSASGI